MLDLLDRFTPGHLIGLVATIGGILAWIITHVAGQWRRVRLAEIEAALKQQMLDRGMGAGEIEQVLRSSKKNNHSGEPFSESSTPSAKAALVKLLTEHGYEGEDIERILRAFGGHPDPTEVAQREGPERGDALRRALAGKVGIVRTMAENGNSAEDIERVLSAYSDDAEWRRDRTPVPVRA